MKPRLIISWSMPVLVRREPAGHRFRAGTALNCLHNPLMTIIACPDMLYDSETIQGLQRHLALINSALLMFVTMLCI
jgi:hypothetical protein